MRKKENRRGSHLPSCGPDSSTAIKDAGENTIERHRDLTYFKCERFDNILSN